MFSPLLLITYSDPADICQKLGHDRPSDRPGDLWAGCDINHVFYRLGDQPLVRLAAERHVKVCGRVQRAGCTCDQQKTMPIRPYLEGGVFDQEDIQTMSMALEEVCRVLRIGADAAPDREVVATRISELAP